MILFDLLILLPSQKYFEDVGEVDIDPELHIDVIERNWTRLLAVHQEKDAIIQDEIKRLDRLQRLAEKVPTNIIFFPRRSYIHKGLNILYFIPQMIKKVYNTIMY